MAIYSLKLLTKLIVKILSPTLVHEYGIYDEVFDDVNIFANIGLLKYYFS